MKTLGIVRQIDALGRITLPKALRRTFGIEVGDPVEIYTENGHICLAGVKEQCICCRSKENLLQKNEVFLCKECIGKFE